MLVGIGIMYSIVIIPYNLAFEYEDVVQTAQELILSLNFFIDLIFLTDMILSFFAGTPTHYNSITTNIMPSVS